MKIRPFLDPDEINTGPTLKRALSNEKDYENRSIRSTVMHEHKI